MHTIISQFSWLKQNPKNPNDFCVLQVPNVPDLKKFIWEFIVYENNFVTLHTDKGHFNIDQCIKFRKVMSKLLTQHSPWQFNWEAQFHGDDIEVTWIEDAEYIRNKYIDGCHAAKLDLAELDLQNW